MQLGDDSAHPNDAFLTLTMFLDSVSLQPDLPERGFWSGGFFWEAGFSGDSLGNLLPGK